MASDNPQSNAADRSADATAGAVGGLTSARRAELAAIALTTTRVAAATASLRALGVAIAKLAAMKPGKSGGATTGNAGLAGLAGVEVNPAVARNAAGLNDNVRAAREALGPLGDTITAAFARGVAAVQGFVAVANPSMFATLTGSVDLLAIQLGNFFGPAVEYVSGLVQVAASYLAGLDTATKGTIARVAVAALVFGGMVVVVRQIVATVNAATVAVKALMAFSAASPVGAILGLVGVLGGLAAAWGIAGQAAKGAQGAFEAAGRANAGTGPGGEPLRDNYTPSEIRQMPESYRTAFQRLAADQQAAEGVDNADVRAARLENIAVRRRQLVQRYASDVTAQRDVLPPAVRAQLQAEPKKARAILDAYIEDLKKEIDKARESILELTDNTQEQTQKRQAKLDVAVKDPSIPPLLDKQRRAYNARTGEFFLNMPADAPEFQPIIDEIEKLIGEKLTPSERRAVTVGPRNGVGVGKIPARPVVQENDRRIADLEARSRLVTEFQSKLGGTGDGLLRSLKLPVEPRYTDYSSFRDSVQTAVLKQDELGAAKLAEQMKSLAKELGDNTQAIREFNAAQQNAGNGLRVPWPFKD